MHCIRKMNGYTSSFSYSLATDGTFLEADWSVQNLKINDIKMVR